MPKKKGGKKNKSVSAIGGTKEGETFMRVDPSRIRFQHSRIRPYFSGCGRGVRETLEQIRNKEISANDLPNIQVLLGPDELDGKGPWYFGLNNRRLWVLKRCKEEGLLPDDDGLILVRVRAIKSYSEEERYTLENCALEAKFIREKRKTNNKSGAANKHEDDPREESHVNSRRNLPDTQNTVMQDNNSEHNKVEAIPHVDQLEGNEDSTDSDDVNDHVETNRFSNLV